MISSCSSPSYTNMDIDNPQTFDHIIEANGDTLRVKVIDIGAWNMDGSANKLVSLGGLTTSDIVHVSLWIYSDTGALDSPGLGEIGAGGAAFDGLGFSISSGTGNISISRITGGFFDSTNFDDAVMNRGKIVVWYIE